MAQAPAIPASAKNQRREIVAWCMYDWANSAYSTIYITVLVLYLQGVVLPGDAGLFIPFRLNTGTSDDNTLAG